MSDWGPWIEHALKRDCPVSAGTWVMVDHISRGIEEGRVTNTKDWSSVIRFRIRRPKGMAILEQLLADIPAPVAPEVVG